MAPPTSALRVSSVPMACASAAAERSVGLNMWSAQVCLVDGGGGGACWWRDVCVQMEVGHADVGGGMGHADVGGGVGHADVGGGVGHADVGGGMGHADVGGGMGHADVGGGGVAC